jgi:transposase
MGKDRLFVGLDTDKRHIDVAVAEGDRGGEVRYWGKIANEPASVDRVLRRLSKSGKHLEICYEAGPCGYGLYRRLNGRAGVSCQVVAPSLTPRRPGSRVKTNRRDSLVLAKLLRADELTAVWVPDAAHEALRDLVRARGAAVADLMRCRQRISGFLLRQELGYAGKPWTGKHRAWLGQIEPQEQAHQLMLAEMLSALDQAQGRLERLRDHIVELAPGWSLAWQVKALQVLRGFAFINAVVVTAEIGDLRRFERPRELMGFVGLVPSEHSSGERVRRGGLTKTGNGRARKALIEAAWTYARPARAPTASQYPEALLAIADKARHRLSRRYRQLLAHGKLPQVAVAAVARELAGFVWAVARSAGAGEQTARPVRRANRLATSPARSTPTPALPRKRGRGADAVSL